VKLKLADTEHTNTMRCLKCGSDNDAATGVVREHARNTLKPDPGSIMLCYYCGHEMALDNNMQFRELTTAERRELAHDPKFQLAKAALKMAIKARPKH